MTMFTPTENKEHPGFLPTIDMSELIDIFDEWCERDMLKEGYSEHITDVDDFWLGLHKELDVNIWRPDVEYGSNIPKIALYPVDEKGMTDGTTWLSIDGYLMEFLGNHPDEMLDSIKVWLGE